MRKKVLLWGAVVVVILGAFGLYWFQPWKLFTSKTINDTAPAIATAAPPSATAAATATLLGEGTLITHEHTTSGTAQLVRLPDGKVQLVLTNLSTSDGPDLRVWLTDQPVLEGKAGWHVFDDGKYVELGRLKGTHGTQVYDVPADVQPDQYTSVTIWCKRFSVSFGAASLAAA
ncbi:MAG TPA: hypothetical protein DGT23_18930 [Micromonosporaceae bacterium]|nr:hypothetical protein [Micromonosporaceae bacterium]